MKYLKIDSFYDVLPSDKLRNEININECGIINLDNSLGNGTHWVAYFNNPNNIYVIYFDSYGIIPDQKTINFLNKSKKDLLYSTSKLQNMNTATCGHYCIYLLYNLYYGKSFNDILSDFIPGDDKYNENKIYEFSKMYNHKINFHM